MALIDCPECGNKISDKAKMCPKCGYVMHGTHTEIIPPRDEMKTMESETLRDSPNPDSPKSKRRLWILLSCAALIVAVCAGGYVWHDSKQKHTAALRLQHELDSIAAVQRGIAHRDSLRQDSIQKVNDFLNSCIKPSDIILIKNAQGYDNGSCKTAFFKNGNSDFFSYYNEYLSNKGYSLIDKDVRTEHDELMGGVTEYISWKYQRTCEINGSIWNAVTLKNNYEGFCMMVEFSDINQADSFMSECKKLGFKKSQKFMAGWYLLQERYDMIWGQLFIKQQNRSIIIEEEAWV